MNFFDVLLLHSETVWHSSRNKNLPKTFSNRDAIIFSHSIAPVSFKSERKLNNIETNCYWVDNLERLSNGMASEQLNTLSQVQGWEVHRR